MPISNEQFMEIAEIVARTSKAKRLQVGAVAVVDNRIVATGYNGTAPGLNNECEDENGETKRGVLHAEVNTVAFSSKNGVTLNGAVLYCTHAPCLHCAAVLGSAGVRAVYYRTSYRDSDGLQLLSDMGIEHKQIEE